MQNQQLKNTTPNPITLPKKVKMDALKNLFFELCQKTCNLKCQNCYIERDLFKNKEDYLELDKIKSALKCAKSLQLNSIYLTGGEPLMHPDFNLILRMCLKVSNTTILTNGTMINDKKARFLRKLDDESKFETIYRVSLDSPNEQENDQWRGRGSFRKALSAINSLIKYEFNPIISVVNYKNKKKEQIFEEFRAYFKNLGFEIEDINLKIMPYFPKNLEWRDFEAVREDMLDCSTSRVVAKGGVYSCPVMAGDYRARVGSTLDNYSDTCCLDSEKCFICALWGYKNQVNDWM